MALRRSILTTLTLLIRLFYKKLTVVTLLLVVSFTTIALDKRSNFEDEVEGSNNYYNARGGVAVVQASFVRSDIRKESTTTTSSTSPSTIKLHLLAAEEEEDSEDKSSSEMSSSLSCAATSSAASSKCVPCSTLDKSSILSKVEIQELMDSMSLSPTWKVIENEIELPSQDGEDGDDKEDGDDVQGISKKAKPTTSTNPNPSIYPQNCNCIARSFVAKNFQTAIDAINDMGKIAEREGHHPNFHLTNYRNVDVVIYTHNVNGITYNDLLLAQLFDNEITIAYSPKWFKENIHHIKDSASGTTTTTPTATTT